MTELKNINSMAKELSDVVESYRKGDISAERSMEYVQLLISPISITDETIVRTVAFFWGVEPEFILKVNSNKNRNIQTEVIARHMLRALLHKKYGNQSLVSRKVGVNHSSVNNSLVVHGNLLDTDSKYREIFHVVSNILNLK